MCALKIRTGPGLLLNQFGENVVISLLPSKPVATTPTTQPWQVSLAAGTESGNYNGTIVPGTIAGILPSNILATFNVTSDLTYWKCTVSTDGTQITSAVINVDEDPPDSQTLIASALPTSADCLFAISQDGNVYRTIGAGNPNVTLNQAVITDKTTVPLPGTPGVDRWYQILFS
jgi:hypothetical protein